MSVTITMSDNPHLLKAFKEIAKALNEPLKIKKEKIKDDLMGCCKEPSDDLLEAIQELENGGGITCKSMQDFDRAMAE